MEKLSLYISIILKPPYFPIEKLLTNYSELEEILKKINCNDLSKYCYFDFENINNILYEEVKIISFINNNYYFSFYFYLGLSIENDPYIINFIYDSDFIIDLDNKNKKETNKLKKLIMSKLILTLIYNFMGINFSWNDNIQKKIKNIENENLENLESVTNIFKELDLEINFEDFKEEKIEDIYIIIIDALIKNKKFEDYNYTYNIIHQLDLDNIEITKKMLKEISKILTTNESLIKDYSILNLEDFLNIKKINFYYFIFKYIKSPLYIYQIPFLLNTRKATINIFKTRTNELMNINYDDNDIKERLYFILE